MALAKSLPKGTHRSRKAKNRSVEAPVPLRRLGPRPLHQHLGLAGLAWLNSPSVLSVWASGSGMSKADLTGGPAAAESPRQRAAQAVLRAAQESGQVDKLAAALSHAGRARFASFLDGVVGYRHHPYRRPLQEKPVLWQAGGTRLRDYRTGSGGRAIKGRAIKGKARPRLLVVPSLINRHYILDLLENASFLGYLAARGCDPFVVDWGAPGNAERALDLTGYVVDRLEAALARVRAEPGGPVFVIGYCMGGLLALALAQRRMPDLAGFIALATPWDFHVGSKREAQRLGTFGFSLAPLIDTLGELPADILQSLFSSLDPFQVLRKFQSFAALDPESPEALRFVALEDWLNDGVALAGRVAHECLVGWYGENTPGRGQWRIGGLRVDPTRLLLPSLVVVPSADRIVPPESALSLGRSIPGASLLTPAIGHVGMMAGTQAPARVWQPLLHWIAAAADMA